LAKIWLRNVNTDLTHIIRAMHAVVLYAIKYIHVIQNQNKTRTSIATINGCYF